MNKKINEKKWVLGVVLLAAAALLVVGASNFMVDPCLHYRKSAGLSYVLFDQRYQNDGITRHYAYDTMITGTSMCENFKTSEADAIFGANSIKVCFSGASYKEINACVERAIKYNENLKTVIRALDIGMIGNNRDYMKYDSYPEYLYNDTLSDDINYLLNGEIFFTSTCNTLYHTLRGDAPTDFDSYSAWGDGLIYGKQVVLPDVTGEIFDAPEKEIDAVVLEQARENIEQNVTAVAREYPQIEFYYFLTPYSIAYWANEKSSGMIAQDIELQRILISECLKYDNIHLFSWCDELSLIADLDNYKDAGHYGPWVNTRILEDMKAGQHKLTIENQEEYLKRLETNVSSYDYETMMKNHAK